MQAIQLCLTEAEGTADSIRAKCQTMAGVDFKDTVWLVSKIKSMFEELFLKYQRLTRTGFTNTEKVKFLTTLYERNPHEEILQLNRSLKNAIQIGTLKTWNEVCDLFEEKEKELIADAEKFKQMKQALQLHEKKTLDHRVMYLPGANSTSHALNTAQQRTNGITSTANDTTNFQPTVNAATGYTFNGDCYRCGMPGHVASHCYKTQFERFTDRNQQRNRNMPGDLRQRSNSNDRDRERDRQRDREIDRDRSRERNREKDRDRYDKSPSPYPRDRSRSRESQNPDKESRYEHQSQSYREKHNNSVTNATVLREQQEVPTHHSNRFSKTSRVGKNIIE